MLSVRCLSVCLSVRNVRALWPNGWTDQDETWHACRPWPWPHCVRWGPSSPPQFWAHICCGQMAAWIKMPLGMELGLSPGDFGQSSPPQFFGPFLLWPNGCMHQDVTWYGGRLSPGDFVLDGDPVP